MLPYGVMKDIWFIAQKEHLDILLYNNSIYYNGIFYKESIDYLDSDILSGGDYVENCLQGKIGKLGSPWAKLFNRSFLLNHSIWFSDLIVSQDVPFVWEAIICAKRVKSISKVGYIYKGNEYSMTSKSNYKKPYVFYSASILYPNVLVTLLNRYRDAPIVIQKGIENEIKTEIIGFFKKYLSYGEEGRRGIYSIIREKTSPVWRMNKYMNRKQKIAFLLRNLGFGTFDAVVKKLFNN